MQPAAGAKTFQASGEDYDRFMGRYARVLAPEFADAAGVTRESAGRRVLDVGCGPGALTGELAGRIGVAAVSACDPSPSFVRACTERHPGVDVRAGAGERLPYRDGEFDVVLAQLVLHFLSDPAAAGAEMVRVARPGGRIAACVWDFAEGMQMLRAFWDAANSLDPDAPDELRTMRFGTAGEISDWLVATGCTDVTESTLRVESGYRDFDELWSGFLAGIGPAGNYCTQLPADRRESLRAALFERLGAPSGAFSLTAVARAAVGRVDGPAAPPAPGS